MNRVCHNCKSGSKALSVCSGCKAMYYCSNDCQKSEWKTHKILCKQVQEANKSGYVKTITKEGTGPSVSGEVKVHYHGSLVDGTVFDSTRGPGRSPFSFSVGKGQVIRGWDEGVATMKVGESATFVISSEYGYGAMGAGDDIPPNSPLVFEVEVISCI